MRVYGPQDLDKIAPLAGLGEDEQFAMRVVSTVLPFKTNDYVVDRLIDWSKAPNDPLFRLTFMQQGMLSPEAFHEVADALKREAPAAELGRIVARIRHGLNPHPSGQLSHNVPLLGGQPVKGVQHKYPETVLVFPAAGQTCFAYCTFCFRWAQFVGDKELTFATDVRARHLDYVKAQKQVTDVLLTGGDPMIMRARHLAHFIEPLLGEGFEHVQTIRIGTKVLSYWPQRFTEDRDADDVLRLFEKVAQSGKQLAVMAHVNHPQELRTAECQGAVRRLQAVGATIRCQSPLLRQVNDDADVWVDLWNEEIRLGMIPYYMFVERDTGPKQFFEVPLWRAHALFADAYQRVSGLARTVRGPSMSATPGKVCVEGTAVIGGEKVFVLKFIQGRNPSWCGKPFFAAFDPNATWFDQLRPAFGESHFFFEAGARSGASVSVSESAEEGEAALEAEGFA
jgi:KamA family protein